MTPFPRRTAARPATVFALVLVAACAPWTAAAGAPGLDRHGGVVTDGPLRVQVLSPTLLRLEYAADRHFEDRPSVNAVARNVAPPPYEAHRDGGELVVRTSALTLRYREGGGPVGPASTAMDLVGAHATARPAFGSPSHPDSLGGWYRGLDSQPGQAGPVDKITLHQGLLNRSGWYLLDDTTTALATPDGWVAPRPAHQGAYQDGYFFGYGHDYAGALKDLNTLTGPADLLPKWAFGNWFSKYDAITADQYRTALIPAFREHKVPVDALVTDTDWKAPDRWAGWNWNPALFPDPQAYLDWANSEHLHPTLNVHTAISEDDPRYAHAQELAHGTLAKAAQSFSPKAHVFDWSDRDQAAAWQWLHDPFDRQGVRQWWLDYCCDNSSTSMPGLTPDSWANELYRRDGENRGLRGFSLGRIGGSMTDYGAVPAAGAWGERRSTVAFTGDTKPDWETLAFEAAYTPAAGAAIGLPYVSHDIGSFLGSHLPDDLYLRWVQLGAFQPVDRLHSDHGDRLPWQYGSAVAGPAEKFLRLRESLVPYLYATARQAHDTGLPMARALYLAAPEQAAAYTHNGEYLLGDQLLVAPVTIPGLTAVSTVWFPPGTWTDLFTGVTYQGPSEHPVVSTPDTMPVFAKAGGVLPLAPYADNVETTPNALTLKVFPHASGETALYDDAGEGLGYRTGQSATTPVRYTEDHGAASLRIAPAKGGYPGQPATRTYTAQFVDVSEPSWVTMDGHPAQSQYDAATRTLTVDMPGVAARTGAVVRHNGHPITVPPPTAVGFTLQAPHELVAGVPSQVVATVSNAGPGTVTAVGVHLPEAAGWTVTPNSPTETPSLAPGETFQATYTVTPPSGAVGEQFAGTAGFHDRDGDRSLPAALVVVPRQISVTFKVLAPPGTPAGDTLYAPGSIEQLGLWEPGKFALTNAGGGIWEGTITAREGTTFSYRYTRGDWDSVEWWGPYHHANNRGDITVHGDADGKMVIDDTATDWADPSTPDIHKAPQYWRDPLVVSTTATASAITVTFQRGVTPASGLPGTVTVTAGGQTLAGTITQPSPGVLSWTPATPLPTGSYQVTVTGVRSDLGDGSVPIRVPYTTTVTNP